MNLNGSNRNIQEVEAWIHLSFPFLEELVGRPMQVAPFNGLLRTVCGSSSIKHNQAGIGRWKASGIIHFVVQTSILKTTATIKT